MKAGDGGGGGGDRGVGGDDHCVKMNGEEKEANEDETIKAVKQTVV